MKVILLVTEKASRKKNKKKKRHVKSSFFMFGLIPQMNLAYGPIAEDRQKNTFRMNFIKTF